MPGTGEGNQPGLPAGKPTGISLPGGFPDASALCPLVVDFTTFGLIRYCRKIFLGEEWGGYGCNMVTFTAVGECVLEDAGTVHGTLNTHRPRGLHPRPSVPTGRAPQGASGTRGPGKVDLSGAGPGWTAHGRPRAAHSETWTWLWQKARCARRSPLSSFIGLSSSGGGRCSAHWVRVERFTRMPRKGLPPPLSGSPRQLVTCVLSPDGKVT